MKLPQTFNLQEGESDTLVTYDCVSLPKKFVIKKLSAVCNNKFKYITIE